MFAVVHFNSDKSCEVINRKKIKRNGASVTNLEVGDEILVEYSVVDLDDTGKEVTTQEDFAGIVLHTDSDKAGAQSFLDDHIDLIRQKHNEGKLSDWAKDKVSEPIKGRKRKKTTKFVEFEDELSTEIEDSSTNYKKARKLENDRQEGKTKENSGKKRKDQIKPKENCGEKRTKTQQILTEEYFMRKKAKLVSKNRQLAHLLELYQRCRVC